MTMSCLKRYLFSNVLLQQVHQITPLILIMDLDQMKYNKSKQLNCLTILESTT